VKERVYRDGMPTSLADLRERIRQAFANIDQEMIDRAVEAYRARLHRCIELEGQSVEHGYIREDEEDEDDGTNSDLEI
jgi:primosomal protein N''